MVVVARRRRRILATGPVITRQRVQELIWKKSQRVDVIVDGYPGSVVAGLQAYQANLRNFTPAIPIPSRPRSTEPGIGVSSSVSLNSPSSPTP